MGGWPSDAEEPRMQRPPINYTQINPILFKDQLYRFSMYFDI